MFGTIRRHQAWLWAIIGGLTVISFLVYGPTNTKLGDASKDKGGRGIIGGHPVSNHEFISALHEVELEIFLNNQFQWPDGSSPEMTRQAYLRFFINQKQKEFGIRTSTQGAAAFARNILDKFNVPLDDFIDKILRPRGMDAADFEGYLRHKLGTDQLIAMIGMTGGLVTPQEAEIMYKLEHQDIQASMVCFSASNYLANVAVTPEVVAQFYTNQLANYRVPERVQVSYVKFNVTNYFPSAMATLTNLDQMIEANVQRLGTNLFQGARTPAESRAAIKRELIRQTAMGGARRAATEFARTLDVMTPRNADNLEKTASAPTNGLTSHVTAPFGREYGPQDIVAPEDFTRKAFALGTDDPFAGPIAANDGVYVIALKQRFAAETPTLASIEDKVAADYRYENAVQLARQVATTFHETVTNGLAHGKTFSTLCAEAAVKPESLPPFSLSTRSLGAEIEDRVSLNEIKQVAFVTPIGKTSAPAGTRDGAFIIHVEKQLPEDVVEKNTELPGFLAYLRHVRQNEAFNLWLNVEIHGDPDFLRIMQQESQEAGMKSSGARPR